MRIARDSLNPRAMLGGQGRGTSRPRAEAPITPAGMPAFLLSRGAPLLGSQQLPPCPSAVEGAVARRRDDPAGRTQGEVGRGRDVEASTPVHDASRACRIKVLYQAGRRKFQ